MLKIEDENWKPFNGVISSCFEAHFDVYISYTERYDALLLKNSQ